MAISLEAIKSRFGKDRSSVGLDIGAFSVKMVKLKFLKETVELAACEIVPAHPDPLPVIEKLAQAHSLDRVNISVSGQEVITRYVLFPKMQPHELRQSLKFEAQKHLPLNIDEVYLDAYILKDNLADNKMLVLVCAAKKDFINSRLKLLTDAGLRVSIIDIDSLGIINSFLFNYSGEKESSGTFALFDMGSKVSSLSIVDESLPGLNRDIYISGENFTQKIREKLNVDFAQAESLKLNPLPEYAGAVSEANESLVSLLAPEIRTSFDYYESQNASSVTRILLSGGGSKMSGFKDSLANALGIEVDYWDPLRKIIFGTGIDSQKLKACSTQLAVAVGIALR